MANSSNISQVSFSPVLSATPMSDPFAAPLFPVTTTLQKALMASDDDFEVVTMPDILKRCRCHRYQARAKANLCHGSQSYEPPVHKVADMEGSSKSREL